MQYKLKAMVQRLVASAGPTFRRFWTPVGFTVLLAATLISGTMNPYGEPTGETARQALALVSGVLASWCAILLWERHEKPKGANRELIANLVALAPAAGITWTTYTALEGLTYVAVSRHIAICVFLSLMFLVIPNAKRGRNLDMYVVRLFVQAVIAVLFAWVLFVGLWAITATVNYLFALRLSHRVYLHIWFVMACVVAPFLFMSGIPKPDEDVSAGEYPKTLSNLVVYVITPVLSLYTGILYLYFAKILLTREWPVGLVSHLVLWYAVFTTGILFFTWPLAKSNKWADMFARYFPKAVMPLLAMMFASLGIRIKHYGITENRYYVLVLGLWLLGVMIYLNLSRHRKSIVIPATLAISALLCVIGPWSSFAVSKWSQNRRLEAICARYGMIEGGVVRPSAYVAQSDCEEISAIVQYFDRYHDLSDITLVPDDFTLDRFEEVFGFPYMRAGRPTPVNWMYYEADNWSAHITDFDYLFDFSRSYGETVSLSQDGITAIYDGTSKRITVKLEGVLEWEGSFIEFIKSIQHKYIQSGDAGTGQDADNEGTSMPEDRVADRIFKPEDMVFEFDLPNLRLKIVIDSIGCDIYPDGREPVINHVGFILLIDRLDT